jgi:rhomboid family GlyGly-CTERM serine protease
MKPSSGLPFFTLALAFAAVAIHALPSGVTDALEFERTALAHGEVWRLVTGHLTHFSSNHLVWDVGVLVVLGTICEAGSRRRTAFAVGVASIVISIVVAFAQPQFETYRGLSGVDCALFGMFAASIFRQDGATSKLLGAFALLAFGSKCIFAIVTGSIAFASGVGYDPVPLAHLVGSLSGFVAGITPGSGRWHRCFLPARRGLTQE